MEHQAALFARVMGSEVEPPDWADARARFDAMLCADPTASVSIEDMDRESLMREALGLPAGK